MRDSEANHRNEEEDIFWSFTRTSRFGFYHLVSLTTSLTGSKHSALV